MKSDRQVKLSVVLFFCFCSLLLLGFEMFGITNMSQNRDQLMPDANLLAQKMPDERFSRICKLDPSQKKNLN